MAGGSGDIGGGSNGGGGVAAVTSELGLWWSNVDCSCTVGRYRVDDSVFVGYSGAFVNMGAVHVERQHIVGT